MYTFNKKQIKSRTENQLQQQDAFSTEKNSIIQ
jgi:hypothetical protein